MRTNSSTLFTTLSSNEVTNLTSVVKETLAITSKPSQKKVFTSADLWRIQRNSRPAVLRRNLSWA